MKYIPSLLLLLLLAGFTGRATQPENTLVPSKDSNLSADRTPEARFRAQPVYPVELLRSGTPGEAKIEFTVDTDGNVRDVSLRYATKREFGVSSAEAILRWKFLPGVRGGKPASVRMAQVFIFADNDVKIAPTLPANTDQ